MKPPLTVVDSEAARPPPPIHLVVPMSGQGHRYRAAGHQLPKPLIDVNGTPMVQRLLENFPSHWPAHFVVAENHLDSGLPTLLRRLRPQADCVVVAPHTRGPGHAVQQALDAGNIPDDAPVLISYCDYGMVWDSAAFARFVSSSGCDACVIAYRGFHAHYLGPTQYAYARVDAERVVEVREKAPFTADREQEYASTGGYYFRSAALLKAALAAQRRQDLQHQGEFYCSLTVQALLQMQPQAHVRVFEVPGFFQWGTPADLDEFVRWERTFAVRNRQLAADCQVAQVLLPMAGAGSRFAGLTPLPKPLIPIFDQPMFRAALASLPRADHTVIVARRDLAAALPSAPQQTHVLLDATPAGQALSCAAGVAALAPQREVLVSACDHAIVIEPERWQRFWRRPDCDAAIFTRRGVAAAGRRPQSYSYVVPVAHSDDAAPQVARVSVKAPVSDHPAADAVLVGTFWFRSAALLQEAIAALQEDGRQVNGELYLDSVFELLLQQGRRVRMLPLDGFICWGEPDSLAESLYWQEMFGGRGRLLRPRLGEARAACG